VVAVAAIFVFYCLLDLLLHEETVRILTSTLKGYGGGVLNSFFYGPINPPFFSDSIVIIALLAW